MDAPLLEQSCLARTLTMPQMLAIGGVSLSRWAATGGLGRLEGAHRGFENEAKPKLRCRPAQGKQDTLNSAYNTTCYNSWR